MDRWSRGATRERLFRQALTGNRQALDDLCRLALYRSDPAALEHVRSLVGPVQADVLREWPELIARFSGDPSWHRELEQFFLTASWPEGVAPPPLRSQDPGRAAAYRLLTGQEFDPDWLQSFACQATPVVRARMLARLRALGLAHLLSERLRWQKLEPWQALQQCSPGGAAELLARAEAPDEDGQRWLERLRAALPDEPLQLDYPRPFRVARRRWQRRVPWCGYVGDRLVVWERPGQLWLWEHPREPRRFGGEHPVRGFCPVPGGLVAYHGDGVLRRWDLSERVWERKGMRAYRVRLRSSPDGRLVLLLSLHDGLEVFRAEDGQLLFQDRLNLHDGHFSPDGTHVLVRTRREHVFYRVGEGRREMLEPEEYGLEAPEHPGWIDRGPGRIELLRGGRAVTLGSSRSFSLSASGDFAAVPRRGYAIDLYELRGPAREVIFRHEPYPVAHTPDERFARLLWQFQHRHQVEIEPARVGLETDIELEEGQGGTRSRTHD